MHGGMHEKTERKNGAAGKSGTGSTARFVQNLRDFDDFYGKEALPVVYCI